MALYNLSVLFVLPLSQIIEAVKKTHIIAIVMLIVAITTLILSSQNLSTYSTFELATKSGNKAKVVGNLSLADPIDYSPEVNPNFFSFYLVDQDGSKKKVILNEPKPRDFERSEQIVVTGKMKDTDEFYASEILLKCPSKYKDEELALRNQEG